MSAIGAVILGGILLIVARLFFNAAWELAGRGLERLHARFRHRIWPRHGPGREVSQSAEGAVPKGETARQRDPASVTNARERLRCDRSSL